MYDHIKKSEDIYQLVPDLLERMQALTELHKEGKIITNAKQIKFDWTTDLLM